jgi:precorrin-2 dehydrogenase/sirohydrochlorin ferrochelatase
MPDYYPAFLDLRGRRCLVVGGGRVAERKARELLACRARVTLVSPSLTEGLAALASDGRIRHHPRAFRLADVRRCTLVIAATGVSAIDAEVAAEVRRQRALVNVVDRPQHCDFIVPSVLRRGELQVAVSTGGRSPALAREIRRSLEPLFALDLGDVVERVGQARRRARARVKSAPARLAAGERAARQALAAGPLPLARLLSGPLTVTKLTRPGHGSLPDPPPPPDAGRM